MAMVVATLTPAPIVAPNSPVLPTPLVFPTVTFSFLWFIDVPTCMKLPDQTINFLSNPTLQVWTGGFKPASSVIM